MNCGLVRQHGLTFRQGFILDCPGIRYISGLCRSLRLCKFPTEKTPSSSAEVCGLQRLLLWQELPPVAFHSCRSQIFQEGKFLGKEITLYPKRTDF